MTRLWKLMAMLLAFSLIAAACGSDDDDAVTSDTTAADTSSDDDAEDDGEAMEEEDDGEAMEEEDDGEAMAEMVTGAGVDAEEMIIRVGLNADLSGRFAALTTVITEGQLAFWEEVNANGGIDGWTVEPVVIDNAYDVPTHVDNYAKFSGDGPEGVVMLTNSTGSPHTAEIADDLVEDEMVAIPLSWYSGWADADIGANVLEVQASYCVESMNGVDYMSQQHGTKVAVIGYPGDYGQDGSLGAKYAIEQLGLELVFDGEAAAIPSADPAPLVNGIIEGGADFVWITLGPGDTAQLIGAAAAAGYTGQWAGNSPSWNPGLLATDLAPILDASYTHSTYTLLWGQGDAPGMTEMIDVMQRRRPEAIADDVYIIGFIEGYIAQQALTVAVANGDITRAGVTAAAKSITADLKGLAPDQSWADGEPNDSIIRGTYLYDIDLAKFTPEGTVMDADANRGYTLLEANFESPVATAWEFDPCFKAG